MQIHHFRNATFTIESGKHFILITQIPTPLGIMIAGATKRGICLLEFADQQHRIDRQHKQLKRYLGSTPVHGSSPVLKQLTVELQEYFAGSRTLFTLPLDIKGTTFQQSSWQALLAIPYGHTISYQEQATAINNPKAIRAVASANKANRIGIIIPCHRVIGKNGKMTGYGGGIWRKEYLLHLENETIQDKLHE